MECSVIPLQDLKPSPTPEYEWESAGSQPLFELLPEAGNYPQGWILFEAELRTQQNFLMRPRLWVSPEGAGSTELSIFLPTPRRNRIRWLTFLPRKISKITFSPCEGPGIFSLKSVRFRKPKRPELATRLMIPYLIKIWKRPTFAFQYAKKTWLLLQAGGLKSLISKIRNQALVDYPHWVSLFATLTEKDRAQIRAHLLSFRLKPKISVIMPVYNVGEEWLRRAIDSVLQQLYPHWELCIADDCSPKPYIRPILEEYARNDSRIKLVFRKKNGHIAEATHSALEIATGEFVSFLDHDDELTEHALYMVAEELNRFPKADLIYSDEDKIDERGQLCDPHFKPDWSPDLLYSFNLVTHLATYRKEIVDRIGGIKKGYEGSQDYDLVLRFIEQIPETHIRHIPYVLYHWRTIRGSVARGPEQKNYAHDNARKAIRDHLARKGVECTVTEGLGSFHRVIYPVPAPEPLVSLVIPTRDGVELLRVTLEGVLKKTDYPCLDIIIVDNQSQKLETLAYFDELKRESRVRVLKYDAPFNYSAINNFAAKQARGKVLGLLNNDLKMISKDWLREMVGHALRPEIGAVGAKLYYADGSIQHAGVILGIGGSAGHSHRHGIPGNHGFVGRTIVTQNLSAVTGACLVTRREVFDEVGGLDEGKLKVAFNDIDFCLKIRQRGYRIIFTPFAELYHLESATRGSDETGPNRVRFEKERAVLQERWKSVLFNDPYYNPNLTLDHENFSFAFPPRVRKPWLA